MIRYAITSRKMFDGEEAEQCEKLVDSASRWGRARIDYVQLREKDLPAAQMASLARRMMKAIAAAHEEGLVRQNASSSITRLLVNSRADVAAATSACGVHLTSAGGELTIHQVHELYAALGQSAPVTSVSCHRLEEVKRARDMGADLLLFGPVFGKSLDGSVVTPAAGLDALAEACTAAGSVPVLALGGVTPALVPQCLTAGASGIAGIRCFLSSGLL